MYPALTYEFQVSRSMHLYLRFLDASANLLLFHFHFVIALNHMKDLGVQMLYLRDQEEEFTKGEKVFFEGFEIEEDSAIDSDQNELELNANVSQNPNTSIVLLFCFISNLFSCRYILADRIHRRGKMRTIDHLYHTKQKVLFFFFHHPDF